MFARPKINIQVVDNGYIATMWNPAEGPDLEQEDSMIFHSLAEVFEWARMRWEPDGERIVHPIPVPKDEGKPPSKRKRQKSDDE